jgi:hypothetical protein
VIILRGEGYSFLFPEGGEIKRIDWHEGSMFAPPDQWFHQHFNSGAEPARYLALRWGSHKFLMPSMKMESAINTTSYKLGGGQILYEEEDPIVYETFAAELAKKGLTPDMDAFFPDRKR